MSRAATSAGQWAADTGKSYLDKSELPFASLVFLLPLIIIYEVGSRRFASDIIAFTLLQEFFGMFGAYWRYLPALAVVGILLAWHIARGDPWKVSPTTLGGMALECFGLATPLIVLSIFAAHHLPLAAPPPRWTGMLVMSLGAGIYEELVFRLMAVTLLSLLFMDVMKMQKGVAVLLIVFIPAILFSAYHYLGSEPFQWRSFAFRAVAGLYFGTIFILRGFGITAGCHAAYDILVVLLMSSPR